MAEVTAGMVKELREKTDAPMMECKKALAEAEGNMARAEEILRVKLGSKAAKASSRIAAEGMVVIHAEAPGKVGAIVEVNCETDFVAKTTSSRPLLARWPLSWRCARRSMWRRLRRFRWKTRVSRRHASPWSVRSGKTSRFAGFPGCRRLAG